MLYPHQRPCGLRGRRLPLHGHQGQRARRRHRCPHQAQRPRQLLWQVRAQGLLVRVSSFRRSHARSCSRTRLHMHAPCMARMHALCLLIYLSCLSCIVHLSVLQNLEPFQPNTCQFNSHVLSLVEFPFFFVFGHFLVRVRHLLQGKRAVLRVIVVYVKPNT
uniref:Uncharacterized protein n=1 Tax=Zea mays TaxID=4577 RepID=A0A804RP17_MAIZE